MLLPDALAQTDASAVVDGAVLGMVAPRWTGGNA
jgi:hypothetical protein